MSYSSIEITSTNIKKLNDLITSGDNVIILFYWHQCGHCIEFINNVWKPLMNSNKFKIPIFQIEQKYSNLIIDPKLRVYAFPSLYFVSKGVKQTEFVANRSETNVKKFIEKSSSFNKIIPKVKKPAKTPKK